MQCLNYADMTPEADWRCTQFTNTTYYRVPGTTPSPWATHVRGFHILTCFEDIMHNCHIGIARDVNASVLAEINEAGADTDQNLRNESVKFAIFRKKHGIRVRNIRFSKKLITRPDDHTYPMISSFVKAAHMKIMIIYLASRLHDMNPTTEYEKLRATMMWGLATFVHILDTSPMWLSIEQANEACYAGRAFCMSYQKLAVINEDLRICLYKIRPKNHFFDHQVDDLERNRLNPNRVNCMQSEDFIGRNARLASKTHRWTVSLRTLERYMITLRMRWKSYWKP